MAERKTALLVDGVKEEEPILVAAFREAMPSGTIIASAAMDDQFVAISEALKRMPALIVVDLTLPPHEVIETVKQLSTYEIFALAPKVAMLPHTPNVEPINLYRSGFNSVLIKPESREDLHPLAVSMFSYWMRVNLPAPRSL